MELVPVNVFSSGAAAVAIDVGASDAVHRDQESPRVEVQEVTLLQRAHQVQAVVSGVFILIGILSAIIAGAGVDPTPASGIISGVIIVWQSATAVGYNVALQGLGGFKEQTDRLEGEVEELNDEVDELKVENDRYKDSNKRYEELNNTLEGRVTDLSTQVEGVRVERNEFARLNEDQRTLIERQETLYGRQKVEFADQKEALTSANEKLEEQVKKLAIESRVLLDQLNDLVGGIREERESAAVAMESKFHRIDDTSEDLKKSAGKITELFKAMKQTAKNDEVRLEKQKIHIEALNGLMRSINGGNDVAESIKQDQIKLVNKQKKQQVQMDKLITDLAQQTQNQEELTRKLAEEREQQEIVTKELSEILVRHDMAKVNAYNFIGRRVRDAAKIKHLEAILEKMGRIAEEIFENHKEVDASSVEVLALEREFKSRQAAVMLECEEKPKQFFVTLLAQIRAKKEGPS